MKLKVWHIPQVPGKPFEVEVENVVEAKLLLDTFAYYDLFQYKNRIKPDYANASGCVYFDEEEQEWYDYHLPDALLEVAGDKEDLDDLTLEEVRKFHAEGYFN